MVMSTESIDRFVEAWKQEAAQTLKLLRALPAGKFDFRPGPELRSLGELAWHLAAIEGMQTFSIERGKFEMGVRPPGLEQPATIEALAPGYERVHAEALGRVRTLKPEDLDREIPFFGGRMLKVSRLLWSALLHHQIHHRGQLVLMCRMAGGVLPGIYGPSREEMAAMRAGR
jgi:uncharacterized damage-inducible protein DinB